MINELLVLTGIDKATVSLGTSISYDIQNTQHRKLYYREAGSSIGNVAFIKKNNSKTFNKDYEFWYASSSSVETFNCYVIRNATGTIPTDFFTEVGRGNIPGHKLITIAGANDSINSSPNNYGDISHIPSVMAIPSANGNSLEILSSSIDDHITGSGAQKVEIHYLDALGDEQTLKVDMDGTTVVSISGNDIYDVQWLHVCQISPDETAHGNITLRKASAGEIYEYIKQGGNQSLSARYKIPNKKVGSLVNWHVSGMKKKIDFQLRATCDRDSRELLPGIWLFQDSESCEKANSGLLDGKGDLFPSGCGIKLSGKADGIDGEGAGSFRLLITDE